VVLLKKGAIAGVDIGGSAPGTRETELLNPTNMVFNVHAVLLTGGSTFGLNAAGGVQQFLKERNVGFHASTGDVIPIVPTAVIYDLDVGNAQIYPEKEMGYAACAAATSAPCAQGPVGAGIGATCGKILGSDYSMRGGLGTASMWLETGVVVGALAVCNPWGDVVDIDSNKIIAGARTRKGGRGFLDTEAFLAKQQRLDTRFFGMDTTLCVVATNARLTREQATKLAMMAQDGIARVIRPSHTMFDGDVVFALSTGHKKIDVNVVGSVAARLVARAINKSVHASNSSKVKRRPLPR
jgi:L-aminopeptidase/D-esterase-like protein